MRTKTIACISLFSILALATYSCGGGSKKSADLIALEISSGTLTPTFDPATLDYTASVATAVETVTVTPTAKDKSASITVNDAAVASGAASGSISLTVGPNTITIVVTAKGGKPTNTYTIVLTRAAIGEGGIGSTCSCDNSDPTTATCMAVIFPFPPGQPMHGCENITYVPPGALLLCLRSYNNASNTAFPGIPNTYFANGYCSVGASRCSGNDNDQYCPLARFGTYDSMESCPSGSVMIKDSYTVSVGDINLNEDIEVCAKSCTQPSDCRTGETDDQFLDNGNPTPTQYTCSAFDSPDKCNGNDKMFCFDPRDLTKNCVVPK